MGNPVTGQQKVFDPGYKLRASDINRINDDGWRAVGVFPMAPGGIFPGGTLVVPPPSQPSAAKAVTVFPPWYAFITQDPSSGDFLGNFFQGTVGGILPSGVTGIALSAGDVNYVWLAMAATAGNITGATLTVGTTYPTLANAVSGSPPTTFNVPIGIFDLSGSAPVASNIVGFGNIWVQPFVALMDTINTGALLTAPFTPWFNWEWGAGD